jgi:hypothetical protein
MKLIKGLLLIWAIKLLVIIASSCSDKGYDYKWHDVILQTLTEKQVSDADVISQSGFGLKINLIDNKSASLNNLIPQLTANAYAGFIFRDKYYKTNTIERVNIIFMHGLSNYGDIQTVTDDFVPENYNPDDLVMPPMEQLVNQLNDKKFEPVQSFELYLKEPYGQELTGRFIIEIKLSDDRVLSDTTKILSLTI